MTFSQLFLLLTVQNRDLKDRAKITFCEMHMPDMMMGS